MAVILPRYPSPIPDTKSTKNKTIENINGLTKNPPENPKVKPCSKTPNDVAKIPNNKTTKPAIKPDTPPKSIP